MQLHPIDTLEAEILPCGTFIFTPLELSVIALARSEKGRMPGARRRLAQALFTAEQRRKGRCANWTLADVRLEALREFVNALHRRGRGAAAATRALRDSGFSRIQETWLYSECAQPL